MHVGNIFHGITSDIFIESAWERIPKYDEKDMGLTSSGIRLFITFKKLVIIVVEKPSRTACKINI